jgi:hypothetical protein
MTPELERSIRKLSRPELLQVAGLVSGLLAPVESVVPTSGMTALEYKAKMWDRHRPALTLWRDTVSLVEKVIGRPRDIQPLFARALDMLFVQGYKSFYGVYLLCLHGHGEDAANTLRRLLELSAQAIYLSADTGGAIREERAGRYIAYFWAQTRDVLESDLDEGVKAHWQEMFDAHKHLISLDKNGRPLNWWGSPTIFSLFKLIGFEEIYRGDYAFYSNYTHGTSQGILVGYQAGHADIRSDRFVSQLVVAGCRYMLGMVGIWNEHFQLVSDTAIGQLVTRCREF